MISLILGHKGSGKTKTMIDMIDKAVKTTSGNIVVIEKCMKLTTEINHSARLVDVDEYGIVGADMLYGFVDDLTAVEARRGSVPRGTHCGVGVVRRLDTFVCISERFGAQGIDVCGVVPGHAQCGYAIQDEERGPE